MSAPRINFAHKNRLNRAQMVVTGILVVSIIVALILMGVRMQRLSALQAQNTSLAAARGLAVVPPATHLSVPEAQLSATNAAINSLNTPWTKILSAIDESKPAELALLELESKPSEHKVRIVAEAEKTGDLYDFIAAVQLHAPFRHVLPISQDSVESTSGSGAPHIRLTFEAEWQ